MYFERSINEKVFQAFRQVMRHPDSRIWTDFVTNDVVRGETEFPEVAQFLRRMDDLGEAFIFGHNAPDEFVNQCGLRSVSTTSVRGYRQQNGLPTHDPVFDVYQFNIAAGQ
jgi:hypothetical protein